MHLMRENRLYNYVCYLTVALRSGSSSFLVDTGYSIVCCDKPLRQVTNACPVFVYPVNRRWLSAGQQNTGTLPAQQAYRLSCALSSLFCCRSGLQDDRVTLPS